MKTVALVLAAFSLLGGRVNHTARAPEGRAASEPLSTDRRAHGVITSVDPASMTIASAQHAVTGRIDPARTKVTLNGKAAKASDLAPSTHAKGELCLDDVWLVIDAH